MDLAGAGYLDYRRVLDHGYVGLVEVQGSEASIVRAARTCYASEGGDPDKDARLVARLLRDEHLTPFRFARLVLDVYCPLFVRSQWERHTAGWAYCEQSFRYVVPEQLEFYLPEADSSPQHTLGDSYSDSWLAYREALAQGLRPEQARLALPQATYTKFTAICNIQALMHWLKLRLDKHAQWEHQEYARAVLAMWEAVMPVVARAARGRITGGAVGIGRVWWEGRKERHA